MKAKSLLVGLFAILLFAGCQSLSRSVEVRGEAYLITTDTNLDGSVTRQLVHLDNLEYVDENNTCSGATPFYTTAEVTKPDTFVPEQTMILVCSCDASYGLMGSCTVKQ
jgi:hypothetical protein